MSTQIVYPAIWPRHNIAGSHGSVGSRTSCMLPRLPRSHPFPYYDSFSEKITSISKSKAAYSNLSAWNSCNRRRGAPVTVSASSGDINEGTPRVPNEFESTPTSSDEDSLVIGEEDRKIKSKFNFENVIYYIQLSYFGILLASIFTGNKQLTSIASFANFVTAMFLASAAFTGWSATRWLQDVRKNLATAQRDKDFKSLLKYGWSAMFWFGFALWYAVPPYRALSNWTGTAGAICCLYGIALAGTSAMMTGSWSFLGPPCIPRRLVTGGPYALLRHPQALGNFLAVIGFSLSGGAVAAALAFITSFYMYTASTVLQEEKMLMKTFGAKYKHYAENVPAFSWALVLLLIIEAVLIWRYGVRPYVPVEMVRPAVFYI